MLINRSDLRLALTAGLGNAFASLSGLPNSVYVPLAVLASSTGTYGSSLGLGRQRIIGSVLGMALLLISYEGLKGVPMPLALAMTLGGMRLLGGLLRLQVGYKVGGQIVVMGWLVHNNQLAQWIPTRLGWTAFGVIITLLSLRLFWPSRGLDQALLTTAQLLNQLQSSFRRLAERVADADTPQSLTIQDYRRLRLQLLELRRQRPTLAQELGSNPERHPAYRLVLSFDDTASRLITSIGGLLRHAPPVGDAALVRRLHRAEADLLDLVVQRLALWQTVLAAPRPGQRLPEPPAEPLELPETWLSLSRELNDPAANGAPLERLERIAIRLLLCRQAEQALRDGEATWTRILSPS